MRVLKYWYSKEAKADNVKIHKIYIDNLEIIE